MSAPAASYRRDSRNEDVCVQIENPSRSGNDKSNEVQTLSPFDRRRKRSSYLRPYASPTSRIIKKSGKYNVLKIKIPQKVSRFARDLGNTLLSIRWRWILISVCIANIVAYLVFTVLWMLMVQWEESYMDEGNRDPCVTGTSSFAGYFILVVETMTTIGSGEITPTDCQSGWIMMTFQALASIAIEGALVTAIFVKMSRPRNNDYTKYFSKKAVICLRDGVHCLIFRVKDVFGKHWAKTNIKAVLIRRKNLIEGDSIPHYFQNLKLEETGLLIWPQEVVHRIDETSPFWLMSKLDFYTFRFEIMIVLEGDSLVTGHPSQSQTSYTNKEILWGCRFRPCVEYDEVAQKYIVNKRMFNEIVKHEIPECSAREMLFARNQTESETRES